MRLHIVRHGESTWNREHRLQGQADVPLTDRGRAQAAAAAERLTGSGAQALWSSDLVRAAETARIIGERLGLDVRLTPALREQGRGRLEGLTGDQLVAEPVPDGLDIADVRWGGGENVPDVVARLQPFLVRIRELGLDSVILVTHGDALCILLAVLDGRDYRDVVWESPANGGIVTRDLV